MSKTMSRQGGFDICLFGGYIVDGEVMECGARNARIVRHAAHVSTGGIQDCRCEIYFLPALEILPGRVLRL